MVSSRSQTSLPSIKQPPSIPLLNLDTEEMAYYQFFVDEVSTQLKLPDSQLILQESSSNASVRHAIVAIGALARSAQMSLCGTYRMDVKVGSHRAFALHQYQKAIEGLRGNIVHLDSSTYIRTGVTCCLLLAFFDNFIGNRGFSLQHIRYARETLSISKRTLPSKVTAFHGDEAQLFSMFLRLDTDALCAMGADENRTYLDLELDNVQIALPSRFYSLEEARNVRDLIVSIGYKFYYRTACYTFVPRDAIPQSMIGLRDHLVQRLHELHLLLSDGLYGKASDALCHPLSRPDSLRLYSTVLLIRLTTTVGAPETACDELLPYFEYLVAISREIIEYEYAMDPSFSGKCYFQRRS